MLALVLSGILVTTQNGTELARESWRDDGQVVTSDINVKGQKATLSVDRKQRNLHIDQNGQGVDVPIPDGAAALMNLHWAAYALARRKVQGRRHADCVQGGARAEPQHRCHHHRQAHRSGHTRRDRHGRPARCPRHRRQSGRGHARRGAVARHRGRARERGDAAGQARAAGRRRRGAVRASTTAAPSWRACCGCRRRAPRRVPVVLFIAGSGPVDRDGNAGGIMRSDSYRLLAEALAQSGHRHHPLRQARRRPVDARWQAREHLVRRLHQRRRGARDHGAPQRQAQGRLPVRPLRGRAHRAQAGGDDPRRRHHQRRRRRTPRRRGGARAVRAAAQPRRDAGVRSAAGGAQGGPTAASRSRGRWPCCSSRRWRSS